MGNISTILRGAQLGVQRGRGILLQPITINPSFNNVSGARSFNNYNPQTFANDYWTEALYNPSTLTEVGDWTDNPSNLVLTPNGDIPLFSDYLDRLQDSVNNDFGGDQPYGEWERLGEFNDERSQTVQVYEYNFFEEEPIEASMWDGRWGGEDNNFALNIMGADAEAGYNVNIGADGVVVGASAEGNLYLVQAEGQAGNSFIGIAGEGQIGAHGEAGADLTFSPRTGDGDLSVQGEASLGIDLSLTPQVSFGEYFQADVALNAHIGPSLSGEAQVTMEDGQLNTEWGARFRPGLDLDADVNYTLNTNLIREDATEWFTNTDFYTSADQWVTDMRLNNSFDHTADFPFVDDSWIDIEMEDSTFDLNDQMILDNTDMNLGAPDNDFDPDFYNNFELPPDSFIDPISNPINGFDTFGIDTSVDSFDPLVGIDELPPVVVPDPVIVDVVAPPVVPDPVIVDVVGEPYVDISHPDFNPSDHTGYENYVKIGDIWLDPTGFPPDFIEDAYRYAEYDFSGYDLVSSTDPGPIGLEYHDGYVGINFNMEF